MDDAPYLMTPTEIAYGFVVGHTEAGDPVPSRGESPRQAVEHVIRRALLRPPCVVMFSGGRDSSAVLAVAAHVARREGLPEPIAVTRVFPEAPSTEESEWQELVIGHLGIAEWHRVELHDELDIVGPIAARHLVEHGVVWPPTIAGDVPALEVARGGSLLDGEGGDNVLGVADHRIAPVSRIVRAPRPVRGGRYRGALAAVSPRPMRAAQIRRRHIARQFTWLREPVRDALVEILVDAESRRPLSFAESVRLVPRRRTQVLGAQTSRALARPYDVELCSPLLTPEVVDALARDGGRMGRGERTDVLRRLVGDLLPDAILTRTSKAVFTEAYMGALSRQFAATWDGSGLDDDLVDAEELQRMWQAGTLVSPTSALLQQAWLANLPATERPTS